MVEVPEQSEINLALLGDPVAHSRSPAIHGAALAHVGLVGRYVARKTDSVGLATACRELRTGVLAGANVTMPLKRASTGVVDELTPVARRVGAVNTLVCRDRLIVGANTDVVGVAAAWRRRGLPMESPVMILGSGAAAAAAMVALGDRDLVVSTRRPGVARSLSERLNIPARVVRWGARMDGVTVVNATPLGMHGEELPEGLLDAAIALFDFTYGTEPTPAVTAMVGRPLADGLELLVSQAAASFQMWTGREVPIEVLESAART